jgi:hypothetical protein
VLLLPLPGGLYHFWGKAKPSFPGYGQSADWEVKTQIQIRIHHDGKSKSLEQVLETVRSWKSFLESKGELLSFKTEDLSKKEMALYCSFPKQAGDACIALYACLAKGNRDGFVKAVGFFGRNEKTMKYLSIGTSKEVLL